MNNAIASIIVSMALSIFFWTGWGWAHSTISTKCDQVGAFHVSEKTYNCKLKEKNT